MGKTPLGITPILIYSAHMATKKRKDVLVKVPEKASVSVKIWPSTYKKIKIIAASRGWKFAESVNSLVESYL